MADSAWVPDLATSVAATTDTPRHTALVRVTHWITALCFFALLVSGIEIVISHPRFYWGETGNVLTPSLFDLPIPSSRDTVPTGYELRAARPEWLEPVSPLSGGLGRGIDRLAVRRLRRAQGAFSKKLNALRDRSLVAFQVPQ